MSLSVVAWRREVGGREEGVGGIQRDSRKLLGGVTGMVTTYFFGCAGSASQVAFL